MAHCRDILNNDNFWCVLVAVISKGNAKWELGSGVSMALLLG